MPGEFRITGSAWQLVRDGTDADALQDLIGIDGITFDLVCSIPRTKAVPVPGGVMFVPPRRLTTGTGMRSDGILYEVLADGSPAPTPGISLLANDPALELPAGITLQWRVIPGPITLGGRTFRPTPWWFDAPAPGVLVTFDELTPVPGVGLPGGTRGPRGLSTYPVPIPNTNPQLFQWTDSESNPVGPPQESTIVGGASGGVTVSDSGFGVGTITTTSGSVTVSDPGTGVGTLTYT